MKWEHKELEFLKDNYKQLSYITISKKLNRPVSNVYWKAFELSLNKGRWNEDNRLNKTKVINLLIKNAKVLGRSPSIREVPIAVKSACQRHFGSFNAAKRAAGLATKENINSLPKKAYLASKELAYIVGLLLGDGSFRYQESKERTSYTIVYASKDKDLMSTFLKNFERWSNLMPKKLHVIKASYKRFPNGRYYHSKKAYMVQIGFKEAWMFLKIFKDKPLLCLQFFPLKQTRWLIKGLWDAEGCISKNNGYLRIHFSNSNEDILELYKKLLELNSIKHRIERSGGMTNITTSDKENVYKFINVIDGITISRKRNKLTQ